MARKRRMFEVEMPEEPGPDTPGTPETFPAGKVEAPPAPRRGPMASAISEVASSSRERQDVAARIRAENDALAHEHVRLQRLGLVLDLIPLELIDSTKLVRDRMIRPDMEMAELKESIRSLGLSNPIRVERAGERFELVQGYRRLTAYRELLAETGDSDRFAAIPAAVWEPGEDTEDLYRRMVDENLVRKDISFAEMAQLALDYAADPAVPERDPDRAVAQLFKSAGYQKRSYIRTFIKLVEFLGKDLMYLPEIPRSLGVALVQRMELVEGLPGMIRKDLEDWDNRSIRDELDVLRRYANTTPELEETAGPWQPTKPAKPSPRGRSKTSFQFDRPAGRVKCTAAQGRLEVRFDRDFSTVDRVRLERALTLLLDNLD